MSLENIGKHIVGDSKWEKLYDGCPTPSNSPPGEEPPEVPKATAAQLERNKEKEVSSPPLSPNLLSVDEQVDEEQEQQVRDLQPEQDDADEGILQNKGKQDERSTQVEHEQLLQEDEEEQEKIPLGSPSNSCSNAEVSQPDSPHSAPAQSSEVSTLEDKNNGAGGNTGLVDNLFQILPYWYLLNRAFGLSNSGGGGAHGDIEGQDTQLLVEEDDEEEEGGDREEGQLDERGTSRCMSPPMDSYSSAATQRLNSILILESLRQQFQANGQSEFCGTGQAAQQGYLSELIGKMGGDVAHSWFMEHEQTGGAAAAVGGGELEGQDLMEEQPLDLTNSSKSRENGLDEGARRLDHLSSPLTSLSEKSRLPFILDEQTSKVFRSNPRSSKGYTAQELQAALHDIQSGKLGTRRAAVIYGIPRSTLRNKVYKLGKDRDRFFTASQYPATRTNINNNSLYSDNKEGSTSAGSISGKLSYRQGLNPDYLLQQREYNPTIKSNRFMNNSSSQLSDEERDDRGNQGLYWKPDSHSVYAASKGERNMDARTSAPKIPSVISQSSLSQLISKPSKRAHSFHAHHQQQVATSSPGSMEVGVEDSCHSGGEMDHGPVAHMFNDQLFCLQQRAGGARDVEHHRQHPSSMVQTGQRQHGSCEDASGSNDLAGKKSRPKRGKYRNYDREALVKAVRAVQNGEMSVHRAGSFFGVPHSTLEYKVKERHLLRRPKRKDVTSPLSHAKSSSPENSLDGTSLGSSRQPATLPPTSSPSLHNSVGGGKVGATSVVAGAGNALKRPRHHSIFPLTSDLRESLNRYLSTDTEQGTNGSRNHGSFQSPLKEMELDDGVSEVDQVTRNNRERSESETEQLLGLDSFIGNRLSNLFQLNDVLLRGKTNGPNEPRNNLLDLTKK
ncbi:Mushroom body large-type Kenyon cell-specific protein 1 [Orchesella cincta]|uniref:Mushroom body large-type Kenyon cell-specific protein 1 n=1 Tax=Orchesella cincta TaxID=48709 RepID=A0A1D2MX65_ORCCI|nr:Mushroom body large-type Kenyon cell-specific protein 1 [Orchesella cincta]